MNAEKQTRPSPTGPPSAASEPRRALFVEDDAIMRGLMATFATMLGLRPDEVESGEQALEYLSKCADDGDGHGEAPDVLLLDVDLPGIDGVTLCERLAAESLFPLSHVVIVSGTATVDDVERARSLGVRRFLHKPFDLDELREALTAA